MARVEINVDALVRHVEGKIGNDAAAPAHQVNLAGFRHFVRDLMAIEDYHAAGEVAARHEAVGWAVSYILLQLDRQRHPEIDRLAVPEPLFIVGFGRTGSTLLHDLLALDPAMRAPRLWELMLPSSHARETGAASARIALTAHQLERMRAGMPLALDIHPMQAEWPEECRWVMPHGPHVAVLHMAEPYWEWLKGLGRDELMALYGAYKTQVQRLQLGADGARWLSKTSAHLHFYPVLFDLFPGARVVRLHRDPAVAVASACSLAAAVRPYYSEGCDRRRLGALVLDTFVDGMARMIAADRCDGTFVDVFYDDLVRSPAAVVSCIYRAFGLAETPEFVAAITRYLAAPPRRNGFRHDYGLEAFGLTRAQVRVRAGAYLEWAGQRSENRFAVA